MHKLDMKHEIIIKHANYIVNRGTKGRIELLLKNEEYNNEILEHKGDRFLQEHKQLMQTLISNVDKLNLIYKLDDKQLESNIFVASPKYLNDIIQQNNIKYKCLMNSLKNDDGFIVDYRKKIISVLGYDDFTSNYSLNMDYNKIEKVLYIFKYKSKINEYMQENKIHKSKYNYEEQDYKNIIKYYILTIDKLLINESLNFVYYDIIWNLRLEVNNLSYTYSEKYKFIDEMSKRINKYIELYKDKRAIDYIDISKYNKYKLYQDGNWSAYHYAFELGLKTCPYCNRQYITPIYTESGMVRGDIDHFFSKSKYPYLSMSIFNLIPCCKFCNSSLKLDKDFTYKENLNPFENGISNVLEFDFIPESYSSFYGKDELRITFKEKNIKEKGLINKAKNNCEIFKLESLYSYHSDIVKKLIVKKLIYSDKYLEILCKEYNNLLSSKEEALEFLLFQNLNASDLDNPLSVLVKDIINCIKNI